MSRDLSREEPIAIREHNVTELRIGEQAHHVVDPIDPVSDINIL